MEQSITIKYFNPQLNIGLINWKNAYLLGEQIPCKLIVEVYKGKLVYRVPRTYKRYSYDLVKQNLKKKQVEIFFRLPF